MSGDSFRCRRCHKQITPMRHLCHTCASIEGDSPLDIGPFDLSVLAAPTVDVVADPASLVVDAAAAVVDVIGGGE